MCNEKTDKKLQKRFLKLMFIGLVFILSYGKGVTEGGEPDEWYTKLGFKEVCKQMKKDTHLLTSKLSFSEFEEAEMLCNKISSTFGKLNVNGPDVPKEFFEFKERFENSTAKLLIVCKDKKDEDVKAKLKAFKHSCRYCHKIFRKELDASGFKKDFNVAVDKLYKDKDEETNK